MKKIFLFKLRTEMTNDRYSHLVNILNNKFTKTLCVDHFLKIMARLSAEDLINVNQPFGDVLLLIIIINLYFNTITYYISTN